MYSGNYKTGKVKNEIYQNSTVIRWLPNFFRLLLFLESFSFQNVPLLYSKEQDYQFLGSAKAMNRHFFKSFKSSSHTRPVSLILPPEDFDSDLRKSAENLDENLRNFADYANCSFYHHAEQLQAVQRVRKHSFSYYKLLLMIENIFPNLIAKFLMISLLNY